MESCANRGRLVAADNLRPLR